MRQQTRDIMREWGFDIAPDDALPRAVRRAAADRRDRPGAGPRRPVRAARRADRRARTPGASRGCSTGSASSPPAGVAVLYISHHLEEVFEICQDVAVLRDGELVLTAPTASLGKDDLVAAMVGGVARRRARAHRGAVSRPAASGTGARRPGTQPGAPGRRTARAASALGPRPPDRRVAAGARGRGGRRHRPAQRGRGHPLAAGRRRRRGAHAGGEIRLHGRRVPAGRQRDAAQRAGIGYIPEDRRAEGFVAHLGVAENVTMTITGSWPAGWACCGRAAGRPPRRRWPRGCRWCRRARASRSASCPAATSRRSPSRGRSRTDPSLIVAITPTRGVDVASKELLLGSLADVAAPAAARACCCAPTSCPTW